MVGAAVVVTAGVVVASVPGLGKGLGGLFTSPNADIIRFKAAKGRLAITVVDRGNLESAKNLDVQSAVEGQTTIIMIKPEGSAVKKGDLVAELDSATLRDNLTNQVITTEKAKADLENANKTLEVAEIAVNEYKLGTHPQDLQTVAGEIALAESEQERSADRLKWSTAMFKIGYVSESQKIADQLAMKQANISLKNAQTKREVLLKFTKQKEITELEANVEKARSDQLAKKATYELELSKEKKLERQIKACQLFAPADGIIVYANETNNFRGNNQPLIEEGATVRERQKIFSLPDISNMRVNAKVHESMVDRVQPGLRARIRVDAFAATQLSGTVDSIAPLPDPSSFFSSDIKVYTTLVRIDKAIPGLKPGMTAQVEILIEQLNEVLAIPVQAILQFKNKDHVYVVTPAGPVRREVKLGKTNDKLIEVKEGLREGEEVALNPQSLMTEEEKREAAAAAAKSGDESKKDWGGAASPGLSPGKAGPAGKGGPGAKGKRKGGGSARAAMQKIRTKIDAKTKSLSPEEQAKLKDRSLDREERTALWKKAGVTDEEIQEMQQAFMQMMQEGGGFGGGRGGPGGGPGGGGFGGGPGGGGGGFGGPGGGGGGRGGFGGGPSQ